MVVLGISLGVGIGAVGAFVAVALILGLAAAVYVARAIDPAWLLSAGIASDVFLARGAKLGVPVSPSRLLLAAGSLAYSHARPTAGAGRCRSGHGASTGCCSPWCCGRRDLGSCPGASAIHNAIWALVDSLGAAPFWMCFIAPLAFGSEAQRRILLGTLVALGGYLGLTALFETLHLNALVWPKYILDPRYGSHRRPRARPVRGGDRQRARPLRVRRGRGDGLAVWRRPWVRRACAVVVGLCAAGCLFTLTCRSGSAPPRAPCWRWPGSPSCAASWPRRWSVTGLVLVLVSLAAIPGFSSSLTGRTHDDSSIWVRKNVARAAVNMVNARPLLGFGWNNFQKDSLGYFRQADTYPLKGIGVPVHNVFLLRAAELGLVGVTLWALALLISVGAAIFDSGGPPELRMWRHHRPARDLRRGAGGGQLRAVHIPVPHPVALDLGGARGSPLTRPERSREGGCRGAPGPPAGAGGREPDLRGPKPR